MKKQKKTADTFQKIEVHFEQDLPEEEGAVSDLKINYKPDPPKQKSPEAGEIPDGEAFSAEEKQRAEEDDTADGADCLEQAVSEDRAESSSETGTAVRRRRYQTDETPRTGRKKKSHSRLKTVMLTIVLFVVATMLTFGYSLWREFSAAESVKGKEIEVTIEEGTSTREVAAKLKEAGVIRYEMPFLLKMYFSDYKGKLRYGTFQLNDGMCLSDIIKNMATGGALKKEASFTIPEGYTIEMTAAKLEKENIMTAQEFLTAVEKAAATFSYKDQLPEKEDVPYQLQGYIYPDTYFVSEGMTGDELTAKILEEFIRKFDTQRLEAAKKAGLTVEEVLIRASLLQKETEKPEEYATIAGVINNRLAKDMKLQFDSTAVYALTDGLYGIGRVTYKDLEVDSPYNTYKYKGLPVGPICSPSLEAIDGVLHPESHKYLYFQMDKTKNDGSNLFFETYEEHTAASSTTGTKNATTKEDAANAKGGTKKEGATDTKASAPKDGAAKTDDGVTKKPE